MNNIGREPTKVWSQREPPTFLLFAIYLFYLKFLWLECLRISCFKKLFFCVYSKSMVFSSLCCSELGGQCQANCYGGKLLWQFWPGKLQCIHFRPRVQRQLSLYIIQIALEPIPEVNFRHLSRLTVVGSWSNVWNQCVIQMKMFSLFFLLKLFLVFIGAYLFLQVKKYTLHQFNGIYLRKLSLAFDCFTLFAYQESFSFVLET